MLVPVLKRSFFWGVLCCLAYFPNLLSATDRVPEALASCNVVWDSPSLDHTGSMPLGNGEIGLNSWVNPQGELHFYISRTDSWDDNSRLCKVGKVIVSLSPNPLAPGSWFQQVLDLETGTIRIQISPEGRDSPKPVTEIRLWVDANHPTIHVTADSPEPCQVTARFELWRTEPLELKTITCSDIQTDRSRPDEKHGPTIVEPDTILQNLDGRIGWYHHNRKSLGPAVTLKIQGLSDYPLEDPIFNRIFGALITADRGIRRDDKTLTTPAGKSHRVAVHVLTAHPLTPEAWLQQLGRQIQTVESIPFETRREQHEEWWRAFWNRSWIFISAAEDEKPASVLEENNHPVRLGVDQLGQNRFTGEMARVSLFDRALSPDEIQSLAQSRETPSVAQAGLLGRWTVVQPGPVVEPIPHKALTGAFSIEAWVRPEKQPAGGGRIVDKITPGAQNGFLLDTCPGNSLRFIAGSTTLVKNDCLEVNQWSHVAATFDPTSAKMQIYHNGKSIAEGDIPPVPGVARLTQSYQLQRFINACGGRGRYPIKYNGSIFTVPSDRDPATNADFRLWGPGYWWQNTRLPYISMCASGDFDLQRSLWRMYGDEVLKLSKFRVKRYFGFDGAYFPECIYFWGAVFNESYGWTPYEDRTDKLQDARWHKWEWVSGPELVYMMQDYYDYTQDKTFAKETLLTTAQAVLDFFNNYYKTNAAGKLVMNPAQACETWWECTNPMPELAGLHAVTQRLLSLPEEITTAEQREFWTIFQKKLPDLPVCEIEGEKMFAPAEKFDKKSNCENPELYCVFPFRLATFATPNKDLAIRALENRADRGFFGWRQDDLFMTYLGLAQQAKENILQRAARSDTQSRFPAFWGPNYDWVPDQDHGGVLLRTVQSMILQTDGSKIFLLPAWPKGWNADFKLHAPYRTTLEGQVRNGKLEGLKVTPEERKKDLTILKAQ